VPQDTDKYDTLVNRIAAENRLPSEAELWELLVASLGEAKARDALALFAHEEAIRAREAAERGGVSLYSREAKIQEACSQILRGSYPGRKLDEFLDSLGHLSPRIKREEILTPEFVAQLEAERERQRQSQLDNIARLRNSPLLPRHLGGSSSAPNSPYGQWLEQHKRIAQWGRTPLEPDVKDALMAAFQDRLARLAPGDAVYDDAFEYLLQGLTLYCPSEASQMLRACYEGSSNEVLRHRLFLAYAGTLPALERAELYAQAMTGDPYELLRQQARRSFDGMLSGTGYCADEDEVAIAQKYAAYKEEKWSRAAAAGDTDEVQRVIRILNREVESDVAIAQQIVKSSADSEVIVAAVGFLASARAMPAAERAEIYRELYERKDSSAEVRRSCIGALASSEHINDPQNRALLEKAALGDADPEVREQAEGVLKEYERERKRFPDSLPE
jgi:hypothetical protein